MNIRSFLRSSYTFGFDRSASDASAERKRQDSCVVEFICDLTCVPEEPPDPNERLLRRIGVAARGLDTCLPAPTEDAALNPDDDEPSRMPHYSTTNARRRRLLRRTAV